MPLTPKMRFRLQRWRNRWEEWRASARRTGQAVMAEQKMCPSCRALVQRGQKECPYCGQRLAVFSATPAGRVIGRMGPAGGIPMTGYLLLANFAMFAVEYAVSGTNMLQGLMSGPSPMATLRLGENLPLGYVLATHQYWRLVTAMFLHANLLHIAFNMWALFDLGPAVESFYGGAKFLTFYMLTGVFGYLVSGVFSGGASLGASGALFGLLGVLIAYGTRRSHTTAGRQLRSMATRWAIYALILAFVIPHVDNYAHIGGLIFGIGLGFVVGDDPPMTDSEIRRWTAVQWLVVLGTLACFVLMVRTPLPLS